MLHVRIELTSSVVHLRLLYVNYGVNPSHIGLFKLRQVQENHLSYTSRIL